eukprot:scaffold27562_cov65-Phaeocystis_antarctica.AAC.3
MVGSHARHDSHATRLVPRCWLLPERLEEVVAGACILEEASREQCRESSSAATARYTSRSPAVGAALARAGAPERRGAVAVAVARPSAARRGSVIAAVGRSSSSSQAGVVRIAIARCWHNFSRLSSRSQPAKVHTCSMVPYTPLKSPSIVTPKASGLFVMISLSSFTPQTALSKHRASVSPTVHCEPIHPRLEKYRKDR